jgi:tetratricopeptide (TPR) repeat protein
MKPPASRFARVKELFVAAVELAPDRRAAYLSDACADDPTLQSEIEAMLLAHDREGPLDSPATLLTEPAPEAEPALPAGARVGAYEILARLGAGGMGVVYAAYHPELDRQIALKFLRAGAGSGHSRESLRLRLLREAQAMARLSHPNVIAVHDVGTAGDAVFLAMELIRGSTLTAWLAERPRSWREIVAAFRDAGRGLAAAHEAGLVHRDFKPDNVLVGRDGRVCVTDFGLARQAVGDEGPVVGGGSDALRDTRLTETGAILGTPAYMAPEQMRGVAADARSDQFSFCVALYEALHGVRPYAGATPAELLEASARGELERSTAARVPAFVQRVLQRGLHAEPSRRFPTMTALLDELAKDPRAKRRRALGFAAVAGVVAIGTAALMSSRESPCESGAAEIARVWSPNIAKGVRASFLATGKAYAGDAAERVVAVFDRYAARWATTHRTVCEATRVRGVQSEVLLDVRMRCLGSRRGDIGALAKTFARADAEVVENAVNAAHALAAPEDCEEAKAQLDLPPPPREPAAAGTLARVLEQIAVGNALRLAGKYAGGRAAAEAAIRVAHALGYVPAVAEAELLLGQVHRSLGAAKAAEEWLERALWSAESVRHHEVAARAAAELVYVVGYSETRFLEGHRFARHARAVVARMGSPAGPTAYLLDQIGALARREGKLEHARAYHQRAVALWEALYEGDHPETAMALNHLGVVVKQQGHHEEALALIRRSLEMLERLHGPWHPNVAVVHANVGVMLSQFGRLPEAITHHERARTILENALGPEHPYVGIAFHNLGMVLRRVSRFDEANRACEAALRIKMKLGATNHEVAHAHNCVANVHEARGDHEKARVAFERALAIREKALGPEHPYVATSLTDVGDAWRRLGKPLRALPLLERAVQILERRPSDPEELALARFGLARALWDSPKADRARSKTLARAARDALLKIGAPAREELARVDRWLQSVSK